MKVILFGASGMVGAGTLIECLEDPRVTSVLVVGRTPTGVTHPKLREVMHTDFHDFTPLAAEFATGDACFFCLGVSSGGMDEATYTRLTYDITVAAAKVMVAANPQMTFCYVSGTGTDSTEKGRSMWARVKGRTENALLAMGFRAAYMFRPGFIMPVKGVRSKTASYQLFYDIARPFFGIIRALAPNATTTSELHGKAFIAVAAGGYPNPILYSRDINALAARPAQSGA
jgi:uncharacterized protein YbjT (DUF2867 family)